MGPEFKKRWQTLKLFDRTLIIYSSLLSVLILIFRNNIEHGLPLLLLHLLIIAIVFILIPLLDQYNSPVLKFLRYWYIVFAFPLLYFDIGLYIHLIFPGLFDKYIIALDIGIFGELPNIWVQQYIRPWVTEIMQIAYGIYWVTIPLGGAIFYFSKRYDLFERLLYYVTITFFLSYFIFIFFPVAGPRFFIADQILVPYKGLFLGDILRGFVSQVGFRGGAFPSSHVGVAVVILLFMWRFKPKTALFVFLPLVIGLSLATVYGQYHYLGDVLAGLLMGIVIGGWGGYQTRNKLRAKTKGHEVRTA